MFNLPILAQFFKVSVFFSFFLILLPTNVFVKASETISSASELDYPPFSVITDDGKADGFSVELLKEVLLVMGYEVDFYVAPWDQIKQDLAEGKIQVLPVVGRTPERELAYDFTDPYVSFYGAVFVRDGEGKDIISAKDLQGKEVAVLKGDNTEEYLLREKVTDKIVTYKTYSEAFQALSEGKHDVVVAQKYMGLKQVSNLNITNISPLSFELDKFRQDFTFAVKEGDSKLLQILSDGLSKVQANGTYAILYDKWIANDPIYQKTKSSPKDFTTAIVMFGGTIMGGVILSYLVGKNKKV